MIIKALSPKKYLEMFSDAYESIQSENYFFAIMPNEFDDFRQFSYVNGLNVISGGSHIDYISNEVVNRLRDSLQKKYKTIKPGDIRNKLMIVAIMKDFKDLKFDSQTKEKVTNSISEIKSFFGNIDFDGLHKRLMKHSAIVDPITEVYKIKEELRKRQEMKGLEKTVKKFKSEKYLPAIKTKKDIFACEGASAVGGIITEVGRSTTGYLELKGKPINAYSADTSKFMQNKELTELYKIITQEGYERFVMACDSDADGSHIKFLLLGFIHRYLPEWKDRTYIFQTPVMAVKKNGKLVRWYYSLEDKMNLQKGEEGKYYKGLGSFKSSDLGHIMSVDGMDKMIIKVEFDDNSDAYIDDWLSDKKADKRKDYLMENIFDITKV